MYNQDVGWFLTAATGKYVSGTVQVTVLVSTAKAEDE